MSAFFSGVGSKSSNRPISSVWIFGRDCRHLTNEGKLNVLHARPTVMNLRTAQINAGTETKNGPRVPYVGG